MSFRLVAANLFIAVYLLFAVFWDSPEINLLHKKLKRRAGWLVRSAGLDHAWTMYMGPFVQIARLRTLVYFADGTVEEFHPPRLYEFRRHYLLAGVHHVPPFSAAYLRYVRRSLEAGTRTVSRIEILRLVTPAPPRAGGWRGRFEVVTDAATEAESTTSTVALWENE